MSYHIEEKDGAGQTVGLHSAGSIGRQRNAPFSSRAAAEAEAEKLRAGRPAEKTNHTFTVVMEAPKGAATAEGAATGWL